MKPENVGEALKQARDFGDRYGARRLDLESRSNPVVVEFEVVPPNGAEYRRPVTILVMLHADVQAEQPWCAEFRPEISILESKTLKGMDIAMATELAFMLVGARTVSSRLEALFKGSTWAWDDYVKAFGR